MVKEVIDAVISDKAFEQIQTLLAQLSQVDEKMLSLIEIVEKSRSTFQAATGFSKINEEYTNLYNSTEKLKQSGVERLDLERQIKASGEKMAQAVNVQAQAIDSLRAKNEKLARTEVQIIAKIQEKQARLKDLDNALKTTQGGEETGRIKVEQALLKSEVADLNLEFKRQIEAQKYAEDSMKGMSVTLNKFKTQYAQLSEEGRNSDFGKEMANQINILDEKLKGLYKSIGDNRLNVGNYEVAGKSLRLQLREIVQDLSMQKIEYQKTGKAIKDQESKVNDLIRTKGSEATETKEAVTELEKMRIAYNNAGIAITSLEKKGGELQDVMDDTKRSIKGMADDAGNTKAVAEGVGVLSNSFQIAQAGMAAFGAEGEDMMKIYAKMMIIQQGFNSLTQITNALQAESTLRLKLKSVWQKISLVFTQKEVSASLIETTVKSAETVAEKVNTAAKVENTVATGGAAAATGGLAAAEGVATKASWTLTGSLKAVGTAIKTIPVIGWILGAVAALGTLSYLLYKHLSTEKELSNEQARRKKLTESVVKIQEEVNSSTKESIVKVDLYNKQLSKTAQGTKEWNSIIELISEETGIQINLLKGAPKDIQLITDKWKEQYLLRIKSETIIKKIAESIVEAENVAIKIRSGVSGDNAKELVETLNLTEKEKELLLDKIHLFNKENKNLGIKKLYQKDIEFYLQHHINNTTANNKELEKQVNIESILNNQLKEKSDTTNKVSTEFKTQFEIEKQIIDLRLTGYEKEVALRESKINQLKKERAEAEQTAIKEGKPKADIAKINDFYKKAIELETKESNERIEKIEKDKADMLIKVNESLINALQELDELRLNNTSISEKELTERLISLEKERSKELLTKNEKAKLDELKGVEEGSELYLGIVKKYETLNQLEIEKSIIKQLTIRKNGFSKTVEAIKGNYNKLKAESIIEKGGKLSEEEENQFQIQSIKDQIKAFDEYGSTLDQNTTDYANYVNSRKQLEADLTLATQTESERRIKQIQLEKQQQFELANAIGDAVFSIGDAYAANIKDEKQRILIEQSLAVAKVLLNQGIAISEAVAAAVPGEGYTIAIRIAAAVAAVVAAISSANQAINQSKAIAYEHGTTSHTGGDAVVAEGKKNGKYKPEMVIAGGKSYYFDQPTLLKGLPIGSKVKPIDTFEKFSDLNPNSDIMTGTDAKEIIDQLIKLNAKAVVKIDVGENVYTHLVKGASHARIINSQFNH